MIRTSTSKSRALYLPHPGQQPLQLLRQRRLPAHTFAGSGVIKAQAGRVKCKPRRAALIRHRLAVQGAIVDAFAAQGSAGFTQVNADLMGAPSLEPAFDEGVIAQFFEYADVCDGTLALAGYRTAAAAAVAAIADEIGFDALGLGSAANDGEIAAFDGVGTELLAEIALGGRRAREDHQAGGVLVEPVHGTQITAFPRVGLGDEGR